MFLETKREGEVQADPYDIETLIGWLELQPGDREYDYTNCHGACLMGQYLSAMGIPWGDGKAYCRLPVAWGERIAHPGKGISAFVGNGNNISTFGAALERARVFARR